MQQVGDDSDFFADLRRVISPVSVPAATPKESLRKDSIGLSAKLGLSSTRAVLLPVWFRLSPPRQTDNGRWVFRTFVPEQ